MEQAVVQLTDVCPDRGNQPGSGGGQLDDWRYRTKVIHSNDNFRDDSEREQEGGEGEEQPEIVGHYRRVEPE